MDKLNKEKQQDFPDRPFAQPIATLMGVGLIASLTGLFAALVELANVQPFLEGAIISITWACTVYLYQLDQDFSTQQRRSERAFLGFFAIITGILIGIVAPIYLNVFADGIEWLIVFGLIICAQVGIALLLASPLRSLSVGAGFLISATVLHSVLLRFPATIMYRNSARVFVISSLVISIWYIGQWLFLDRLNPLLIEDSKSVRNIKSFIGVASGLIAIIEFFNILYTMFHFNK